jgi:hypothetical protein
MKNQKFEPKQVAKWLNNLSNHAFIEFFYEQLSTRHISCAEERYIDSHLVLAAAKRVKGEQDWKTDARLHRRARLLNVILRRRRECDPKRFVQRACVQTAHCRLGFTA